MPTFPKLIAAFWFALLAWFCAGLVKNHFPENMIEGRMSEISAVIGFLVGWIFAGRRAGDTMRAAYGYGLTSSVLIVLWSVGVFAVIVMLERSWDGRYRGPMHALTGMVDLAKDYALFVLNPDVVITLVVGGLFGGWLTEKSAARWS